MIWSDKMLDFAINLCELADPAQLRISHQRGRSVQKSKAETVGKKNDTDVVQKLLYLHGAFYACHNSFQR